MKKPTKQSLRRKADALLQEYIKALHKGEVCFLCGEKPIQVGHHFIYKSQSNATRYYLPNIIPLCNDCHCLIHTQPSIQNAKIALNRGIAWLVDLTDLKRQGQKFTKEWIETQFNILTDINNRIKATP